MRAGERANARRAGIIGHDAEIATAMMHTTASGGLVTGATRAPTTTKAHVQSTTTPGPYTVGNDTLTRKHDVAAVGLPRTMMKPVAADATGCGSRRIVPAAGGTKWTTTRAGAAAAGWGGCCPGSKTMCMLSLHENGQGTVCSTAPTVLSLQIAHALKVPPSGDARSADEEGDAGAEGARATRKHRSFYVHAVAAAATRSLRRAAGQLPSRGPASATPAPRPTSPAATPPCTTPSISCVSDSARQAVACSER